MRRNPLWSLAQLWRLFEDALARSKARLADALVDGGVDQLSVGGEREWGRFTLRGILIHLIEEYARHCGHADLIRESVDGSTGD